MAEKNLDEFLNKMIQYYKVHSPKFEEVSLFPSFENKNEPNVKKRNKKISYLSQLIKYRFKPDELRLIFYGSHFMKNLKYEENSVIPEIIKRDSYNDLFAFSLGLGKIRENKELYETLKNFVNNNKEVKKYLKKYYSPKIEKESSEIKNEWSALAYLTFRSIMDLGYENPKIRGKRDGKERRNYYKDLFIDDYLSKKFILAFLGAKIPINGYEYKIFYKKSRRL